jgi:hypothetical protein
MRTRPFWIKERHNPQLGTRYEARGQMSYAAAKRECRTLYGENLMHEYRTKSDYEAKLKQLQEQGQRVIV